MNLKSLGLNIFNTLGMLGTPASRDTLVPAPDTPDAEQRLRKDFISQGTVANPDTWVRYSQLMKQPGSYRQQLATWEEMSSWDLMAAVLSELVEEAVNWDSYNPGPIWYECNDVDFQQSLNRMLRTIGVESLIASQAHGIASLGNHFERVHYSKNAGVTGLSYIPAPSVRRYWLERNRRCIGYMWDGQKPDKESAWVGPDNVVQLDRVAINASGKIDELWYPWDILHFRRLFRIRETEHGEPICAEAEGIYRKLRMAIDQMVVHRAQVQPDRYVINIDTQDQPPTEQLRTVNTWRRTMRMKTSFGAGGGSPTLNDPNDFRSFYNPLALDTILWVARPKGYDHSITKLAGTPQVPDVYDIELLTDLFFSIVGAPKMWFGLGPKDSQNPPSGKAMLAQDVRSLRKVRSIRRPLIEGYLWLAYFHAVLLGKDPSKLVIKVKMSEIGGLEDQLKLEMLNAKSDLLLGLGDVMDKYSLPKDVWVDLIFRQYLHLPDTVVNQFLTSLPPEAVQAEESLKKPTPSRREILAEVDAQFKSSATLKRHAARLQSLSHGEVDPDLPDVPRYASVEDVLEAKSNLKPNDVVRSPDTSFSVGPIDQNATSGVARAKAVLTDNQANGDKGQNKTIWESKSWRKYIQHQVNG